MDTETIFSKIKELRQENSKREDLQEYCKSNFDQIIKFFPQYIISSIGRDLFICLMNGLTDNSSNKNKVKVIDIVLQVLRKKSTSTYHCEDVMSRLCLELHSLPADDLVRWSNDSIQAIIDDSDVSMTWKDVLPECLNALLSHNTIKHCGIELTTEAYKEQCVHTLCQCRWKEKQLVQLAAMFKVMQLSRNDHKQVVTKMCSYMIDIPPDTLPTLVHQLIKLCTSYDMEIVLAHLSHYFSVQLYSKLEPPPQDSESTTMDIDDIVQHSPDELSQCLSTCLYHIFQGVAVLDLIRKHLKAWPKTQLLRAPFLIDVALALSDKGRDFKTACLDVIKSAIEHRIQDEQRGNESAWVRSVLPPDVNVASVLKILVTESANHRQFTSKSLIDLAFSLLSVSRIKPVAPECWSHGKLILVRLVKSQPETTTYILSHISDRLTADSSQRQYADCVYILCKLTPLTVERCSELSTILEICQQTPGDYKSAAAVIEAVHPLINYSIRLRDTIVMVCRKGLHSRDSVYRCLALSGLLTVLRHVRLSQRSFSSTQSVCSDQQLSEHSYLTQLTVDLHITQHNAGMSRVRNETVCLELISLLRRCLTQDATVKQLLYEKLHDCVKEKLVLHESVLELLHEHLCKYLSDADDTDTSLLLDKCVQLTDTSAILVEPISHLLYAIAQFVQPTEEENLEDILTSQMADNSSEHLKSKLKDIMEKLSKMNDVEWVEMLQEEPGLTDLTPASRAKSLKVQQILQCYEALIAHQIMQWNYTSDDVANTVCRLFKAYNHLLEQTKAPSKLGKKSHKSTLNDTKDTSKSQKSKKSQNDNDKAPVTAANVVKDRTGPFKPLPCLWSPKLCLRVLELLYSEEVRWSSIAQRNKLRGLRDVNQWSLRCIHSALTAATNSTDKYRTTHYVTKIAASLYERCICRFQDMCDFDDLTALGCAEVFKDCLAILFSPNYSLKMDTFLTNITGESEMPAAEHIAMILERLHTALRQVEADSTEERDAVLKKLFAMLSQIVVLLLEVPVHSCPELSAVIIKLEEYVCTSKQDCLMLVPALLTAGCREQPEAQLLDDLMLKLAQVLGNIYEENTSLNEDVDSNFPAIDSRTGQTILNHVCTHLGHRFRCSEHLLARARDLTVALNHAAHSHLHRIEKELNELYKSIVIQLCQLTRWTCQAAKLRCCIGGGSDRVLGACVRLYATLATLAKQLGPEMAQLVRFERLLKLSGKKLSTMTNGLIEYLVKSQQQSNASKVLRDTKLIPRLVLETEQYTKNVILLENKAKVNYQQYLSLGLARDFKIKPKVLQEVLNVEERRPEDANEHDVDINDAATEILQPLSDNEENEPSDDESVGHKRRKLA